LITANQGAQLEEQDLPENSEQTYFALEHLSHTCPGFQSCCYSLPIRSIELRRAPGFENNSKAAADRVKIKRKVKIKRQMAISDRQLERQKSIVSHVRATWQVSIKSTGAFGSLSLRRPQASLIGDKQVFARPCQELIRL
jgi:hypothetical protein